MNKENIRRSLIAIATYFYLVRTRKMFDIKFLLEAEDAMGDILEEIKREDNWVKKDLMEMSNKLYNVITGKPNKPTTWECEKCGWINRKDGSPCTGCEVLKGE